MKCGVMTKYKRAGEEDRDAHGGGREGGDTLVMGSVANGIVDKAQSLQAGRAA